MSKKITKITTFGFALILEPALKKEFEDSLSFKSIDNEDKEYLIAGYTELCGEICEFIDSGKFRNVQYLFDACIVKLEDGFYKMFISLLGNSRKSDKEITKDFSCVLNVNEVKAGIEYYQKWVEEEEERHGAIILAEIEAEELKQKNNTEEDFADDFNFEEVLDELSNDMPPSGRAKRKS